MPRFDANMPGSTQLNFWVGLEKSRLLYMGSAGLHKGPVAVALTEHLRRSRPRAVRTMGRGMMCFCSWPSRVASCPMNIPPVQAYDTIHRELYFDEPLPSEGSIWVESHPQKYLTRAHHHRVPQAGCGECGGSGCSDRGGGLTGDDCCHSDIKASGRLCSDTGAAPCMVDGESETFLVVARRYSAGAVARDRPDGVTFNRRHSVDVLLYHQDVWSRIPLPQSNPKFNPSTTCNALRWKGERVFSRVGRVGRKFGIVWSGCLTPIASLCLGGVCSAFV